MTVRDEHVWMILGDSAEEGACVAVIVGATTVERAQELYRLSYPGHVPLAWPNLFDLQQSVRTLQHARDGVADDACPVINDDGAEVCCETPNSTLEPCPVSVLRVLDKVRELMEQRGLENPFNNDAASFACAAFEARAFRWEPEQAPGFFRWRDLEVTWYKHLHRDPRISRVPSKHELMMLWEECRASILLHEERTAA